jgi:hypothetical protein
MVQKFGADAGRTRDSRDPPDVSFVVGSGIDLAGAPHRPTARSSVRERLRQPEPWEHTAVEARHGADPIAGEGKDEEAGTMTEATGRGAKVGPERRLTIRPRRHEVVPSAANEGRAEAADDVAAVVFERNWWHGDADIGGEQGNQRVDITGLPCANELSGERLLRA